MLNTRAPSIMEPERAPDFAMKVGFSSVESPTIENQAETDDGERANRVTRRTVYPYHYRLKRAMSSTLGSSRPPLARDSSPKTGDPMGHLECSIMIFSMEIEEVKIFS